VLTHPDATSGGPTGPLESPLAVFLSPTRGAYRGFRPADLMGTTGTTAFLSAEEAQAARDET
jgi:hypothetical protein